MNNSKKTICICCLLAAFSCTSISIAIAQGNIIMVALFSGLKEKMLPSEWKIKEWKGRADVRIVNDNDSGQVICLKSAKTSTALYKDIVINIKDYPILNWRWKVTEIPAGGDVRKKRMDDQAAQIYVVFPKFPSQINSRMLGYIWDSSAPVGSEVTSAKLSTIKYIVVRSGRDELGKWISEKRNVYDDYRRLFGEDPPPAGSIALMIDSDNTRTTAESFFGDISLASE